jgi:hypothetical protein
MESVSSLELSSNRQSNGAVRLLLAVRKAVASAAASARSRDARPRSASDSSYRLGEAVSHHQFGAGQVLARWPDGSLLVRFDGAVKNRLVWPSLLQR